MANQLSDSTSPRPTNMERVKFLPISEELLNLLEKWKGIVCNEGYILRSINKHGHIGDSLNPASISTILKDATGRIKIWIKPTTTKRSFI